MGDPEGGVIGLEGDGAGDGGGAGLVADAPAEVARRPHAVLAETGEGHDNGVFTGPVRAVDVGGEFQAVPHGDGGIFFKDSGNHGKNLRC